MAAIPTTEVTAFLNSYLSTTAYTKPTSPFNLRLMTVNGSDTSAGTPVTPGGGYTATGVAVAFTISNRQATNTAIVNFTNMPAVNGATFIVGVEVYDTTGTPRRLLWGALSANKQVDAGDTLSFAASALTFSIG